jgi:uncharacterized protein
MERESLFGRAVIVVLALAVIAALVDAAMYRRAAPAAPPTPPRVLAVTADAYAEAEPDLARVSLGVKAVRPTPRLAAMEVAVRVARIKAKLLALGLPKDAVETSELYLGEATVTSYSPKGVVSRRLGYKAYHWLRVTLRPGTFNKLATVIDGAVAAGATSLADLSFEMEDDTLLRAEALRKATERARMKAEAMALGSGARIAGVQTVSDRYSSALDSEYWRGAVGAAKMAEAAPGAPGGWAGQRAAEAPPGGPAVPGKLRLSCAVEAVFLLE